MGRNYEPIRTEDFLQSAEEFSATVEKLVSKTLDEVELNKETQLDRIEKKLDSILEKMEGKELSMTNKI